MKGYIRVSPLEATAERTDPLGSHVPWYWRLAKQNIWSMPKRQRVRSVRSAEWPSGLVVLKESWPTLSWIPQSCPWGVSSCPWGVSGIQSSATSLVCNWDAVDWFTLFVFFCAGMDFLEKVNQRNCVRRFFVWKSTCLPSQRPKMKWDQQVLSY